MVLIPVLPSAFCSSSEGLSNLESVLACSVSGDQYLYFSALYALHRYENDAHPLNISSFVSDRLLVSQQCPDFHRRLIASVFDKAFRLPFSMHVLKTEIFPLLSLHTSGQIASHEGAHLFSSFQLPPFGRCLNSPHLRLPILHYFVTRSPHIDRLHLRFYSQRLLSRTTASMFSPSARGRFPAWQCRNATAPSYTRAASTAAFECSTLKRGSSTRPSLLKLRTSVR